VVRRLLQALPGRLDGIVKLQALVQKKEYIATYVRG